MIPVNMTNDEKAILTITPVTSTGKPAKVDGIPTWETSDETIVGPLTVAADGLSCEAPSTDEGVGDGIAVTVSADADLGDGVETITEQFLFTVTHPRATSLGGSVNVVPK